MKIEGPRNVGYTQSVTRTKKAGSTSSASFVDHVAMDETSAAGAATSTSPVMSVDQLIGLQEVDDALVGRKQATAHATEILDRLDMLRLQILDGRISKDQLMQLARTVSARRAIATDPRLIAVLDEIDLRAQVEIAKFTRDLAPNNHPVG
jgi:hypothetical protein